MRIESYTEKAPANEPLRLKLMQSGSDVMIIAVDKFGNKLTAANIVRIKSDGSFHRQSAVNKDLGLKLDSARRIVIRS